MIITKEMLDDKVPKDKFPTRLDSAINLYANIENKGIVLYNVNPTTWNCLYPFYELEHKFTMDDYQFSSTDMTYRELLSEYQQQYHIIYEEELGYNKEKRKEILLSQYKDTFDLKEVHIGDELESLYELKYSKSKNVWTLYYFENYVANKVDNLDELLNQSLYEQKILPLDSSINTIDGVDLTSNIPYLLSIETNIEKLDNSLIECGD